MCVCSCANLRLGGKHEEASVQCVYVFVHINMKKPVYSAYMYVFVHINIHLHTCKQVFLMFGRGTPPDEEASARYMLAAAKGQYIYSTAILVIIDVPYQFSTVFSTSLLLENR